MNPSVLVGVTCLLLTGCFSPKAVLGKLRASATKDAGTPAVVEQHKTAATVHAPEGTKVKVEKTDSIPATSTSPFVPSRSLTEYTFPAPAIFEFSVDNARASTSTVDTSVALAKVSASERRPLLYCAIGAVVAGLGFMYVRFSSIAVMCFVSAGVFFAAWRISEIPSWIGAMFLVAAVAGFAFYKRAEWDKNGDGIPDMLQK